MELIELGDEKTARKLKEISDYFLARISPQCFNPYDERSVLIDGEREFEEICNSMEDAGVQSVRETTVFEFYSKVQYLENKVKKLKNVTGKPTEFSQMG